MLDVARVRAVPAHRVPIRLELAAAMGASETVERAPLDQVGVRTPPGSTASLATELSPPTWGEFGAAGSTPHALRVVGFQRAALRFDVVSAAPRSHRVHIQIQELADLRIRHPGGAHRTDLFLQLRCQSHQVASLHWKAGASMKVNQSPPKRPRVTTHRTF